MDGDDFVVQRLDPLQGAVDPTRELTYWTTKDGQRIPISGMTDSHLMNIIHRFIDATSPATVHQRLPRHDTFPEIVREAIRRALPVADNVRTGYYRYEQALVTQYRGP